VRAEGDAMMAEASMKMAEAVEALEKARKAEADRVASGGFVPRDVHQAVLSDLEACKKIVRANEEGSRDGTVLAYKAARATADARASREAVEGLKAKMHLAKIIGEYDYSLMFNEPAPTEVQMLAAEARAEEAVAEEGIASVATVVMEKEDEVRCLRQEIAALKETGEQMREMREQEVASLREEVDGLTKQLEASDLHAPGSEQDRMSQGKDMEPSMVTHSVKQQVEAHLPPDAAGPDVHEAHDAAGLSQDADDPIMESTLTTPPPGRPSRPQVSRESLAAVVNALVASQHSKEASRQQQQQQSGAHQDQGDDDEEELYRDAISMLQEELAKLTDEMVSENDLAKKLRASVGDWKTAQLSAKQTAELLDSYNAMSMKLAAQSAVMTQRQEAFERSERQLMNEIADLRMEIRRIKGKSPLRSVKKAFSSTVKGIRQSMTPPPAAIATTSPLSDAATRSKT
jgi:hypothetical protein